MFSPWHRRLPLTVQLLSDLEWLVSRFLADGYSRMEQ